MALIDELKEKREVWRINVSLHDQRALDEVRFSLAAQAMVDDLDTAIAALEPAPAEPEAAPYSIDWGNEPVPAAQAPTSSPSTDEGRSDPGSEENAGTNSEALAEFMKRDGATEWLGGGFTEALHCKDVEVLCRDGRILQGVSGEFLWSTASELLASGWKHEDAEGGMIREADDIIAYRIISQPADQSEELGQAGVEIKTEPHHERNAIPADETHTDDLRTAEGETVAGDDRIETQSVTSDPAFLAAVERAEATLRGDELLAQNPPIVPVYEASYVGLQDPELDAEFDAMKRRETADRKLHFSIFGMKREDA